MLERLDLNAINGAPVSESPYPHFCVEQAIINTQIKDVLQDFPAIANGGSFPLSELEYGPAFAALIKELDSDEFRKVIEEKLSIDLAGRPMTVTARGVSRAKDGRIHTDSKSKLITVLIYLNESWSAPTGRLRVLNNGTDMDDYVKEITPTAGSLFAFKVTPDCWHGYRSFEGRRCSIQVNFVADDKAYAKHQSRHGLTAKIKSLFGK
ncbi:MAG: 2OG-Fe(II) oxygenase [Pseudomonadales bacterium]|nr:2OG-Fe(II) oxygenase [Pseudomonadales bacterium]